MDEASSARHGPFYITGILDIKHADIKETDSQIAGGGVSVYYSHTLQLLFFSYAQGEANRLYSCFSDQRTPLYLDNRVFEIYNYGPTCIKGQIVFIVHDITDFENHGFRA